MEAAQGGARDRALAQLKRKREFRATLAVFVVVNAFLWILWALSDDRGDANGIPWPLWVTIFWGLGMVLSAWNIYGQKPISEDEIDREMQKIR